MELIILYRYGQTETPETPFYFSDQMKKFLIRNKMFYCVYPDKVVILDQVTGYRLKVIDTKSKLIKMDSNGKIYLLDHERSMIVIYDFHGDFLDEVQLNGLSKEIDFFIDNQNYTRFITNGKKISHLTQIIQEYQ